jgi:hypothetical protein
VHDIADIELRGVPGVFVATEAFVVAAETQARALGFSAAVRVFVPHPVQDRTADELRTYADGAYAEIVAAITS